MNDKLSQGEIDIVEKVCIYMVNRYQTTNSCDLVNPIIKILCNELFFEKGYRRVMQGVQGQIFVNDEEGVERVNGHIFNVILMSSKLGEVKPLIVVDGAVDQFKRLNKKVPSYIIEEMNKVPLYMRYKMAQIDHSDCKFDEDDIEDVLEDLRNNPKEEINNIPEQDKIDLYCSKKLYI